jgi:hypothetical protein
MCARKLTNWFPIGHGSFHDSAAAVALDKDGDLWIEQGNDTIVLSPEQFELLKTYVASVEKRDK